MDGTWLTRNHKQASDDGNRSVMSTLMANTLLIALVGAYFYIVWGIWLRHCLNGRQDEYKLVWPSIFTLPEVNRTDKSGDRLPTTDEIQNGRAKKSQ
jgi:hypothetical protein